MVTDHNVLVPDDPLGLSSPYSSYGIGMSLFMAWFECFAPILRTPTQLDALINPMLLGATAVVVWFLARVRGAGPRLSAVCALTLALATPWHWRSRGQSGGFRTRPRRPLQVLFAFSVLFAPSLFLLAGAAQPAIVAAAMLFGGIAMMFANTVWRATLQERILGSMLARVSACD